MNTLTPDGVAAFPDAQPVHHTPNAYGDRFAQALCKGMRLAADLFFSHRDVNHGFATLGRIA